jgi:hypothetical protein
MNLVLDKAPTKSSKKSSEKGLVGVLEGGVFSIVGANLFANFLFMDTNTKTFPNKFSPTRARFNR